MTRCDCWEPTHCPAEGTHYLIAPDGEYCPGGPVCEAHANAICTELRAGGEGNWIAEPAVVINGVALHRRSVPPHATDAAERAADAATPTEES